MKLGIVSDVHNNVPALSYALAHLADCDLILNLGDLVFEYRVDPEIVVIARRAGVRHRQIAAAYRKAGYQLVESLDEGDHSHFAFNFNGRSTLTYASREPEAKDPGTKWGVVTVAAALLR